MKQPLKSWRKQHKWTIAQAARMAKVSVPTWIKAEQGLAVSAPVANRLKETTGVTVAVLSYNTKPPRLEDSAVLDLINAHPGANITDLILLAGFSSASVRRIISRLLRKGQIRREVPLVGKLTLSYFPTTTKGNAP